MGHKFQPTTNLPNVVRPCCREAIATPPHSQLPGAPATRFGLVRQGRVRALNAAARRYFVIQTAGWLLLLHTDMNALDCISRLVNNYSKRRHSLRLQNSRENYY